VRYCQVWKYISHRSWYDLVLVAPVIAGEAVVREAQTVLSLPAGFDAVLEPWNDRRAPTALADGQAPAGLQLVTHRAVGSTSIGMTRQ